VGISIEAGCLDELSPAGTQPTGFGRFDVDDRDKPYGARPSHWSELDLRPELTLRSASSWVIPIRISLWEIPRNSTARADAESTLAGHPKTPADTQSTGARGQAASFSSSPAARSI